MATKPTLKDQDTLIDKALMQPLFDTVYDGLCAGTTPAEIRTCLGLDGDRVIVVDTVADLRAHARATDPSLVFLTLGAVTAGDGGGGVWRWDAYGTGADDTGMFVLPAGHTGAGRRVRVPEKAGFYSVAWFGVAEGLDSGADVGAVMQHIHDDLMQSGGEVIYLPPGIWETRSSFRANKNGTVILGEPGFGSPEHTNVTPELKGSCIRLMADLGDTPVIGLCGTGGTSVAFDPTRKGMIVQDLNVVDVARNPLIGEPGETGTIVQTYPCRAAIEINGCTQARVQNVFINGVLGAALYLVHTWQTEVCNVNAMRSGSDALGMIHFGETTPGPTTHISAQSTVFTDCSWESGYSGVGTVYVHPSGVLTGGFFTNVRFEEAAENVPQQSSRLMVFQGAANGMETNNIHLTNVRHNYHRGTGRTVTEAFVEFNGVENINLSGLTITGFAPNYATNNMDVSLLRLENCAYVKSANLQLLGNPDALTAPTLVIKDCAHVSLVNTIVKSGTVRVESDSVTMYGLDVQDQKVTSLPMIDIKGSRVHVEKIDGWRVAGETYSEPWIKILGAYNTIDGLSTHDRLAAGGNGNSPAVIKIDGGNQNTVRNCNFEIGLEGVCVHITGGVQRVLNNSFEGSSGDFPAILFDTQNVIDKSNAAGTVFGNSFKNLGQGGRANAHCIEVVPVATQGRRESGALIVVGNTRVNTAAISSKFIELPVSTDNPDRLPAPAILIGNSHPIENLDIPSFSDDARYVSEFVTFGNHKTTDTVAGRLKEYADNAAALAGGATKGTLYATPSGEVRIVVT